MSYSLAELVEGICKRSRMYTLEGTFEEVVAFLAGYVMGRGDREPELVAEWDGFAEWLLDRFRAPRNLIPFAALRRAYPEDGAALEQLRILYAQYRSEVSGGGKT